MAMATLPELRHERSSSRGLILIALILLLAVIGGTVFALMQANAAASELASAPVVEGPVVAEPAAKSIVPAAAFADTTDKLLVWQGIGAAPGQQSSQEPGQLSFMDGTGALTPIMEIPAQTSRVNLCGDTATSPDGTISALYVGLDAGALYVMKGGDAPTKIDDVNALTCLGNGTFQYSPDGSRMAYIAYEPGAEQSEFPDGFLHVFNTSDLSEVYSYENVTAFDLTNDGVAFISFFTNDKNEADEAAVLWWSGSAEVEVATLQPTSEDCKFTSGQLAVAADGKYVSILGHRCKTGETRTAWQLYSIDPSARSATLAASDFQAGSFAAFARTNNLFLSPDGRFAYFTVPDGVTANTVGLKVVNTADMSLTDVLDRQAVMPTFNGGANATPQISPDGKWLALVVTAPSNDNVLTVYNLSDPAVAPITLSAGSSGDTISALSFTPDSSRVLVVAGGDESTNNSLVALDLATGNNFRVSRGRFDSSLVLAPDGSEVALLDWQVLEDPREPPFANTVFVKIESSESATVYTGAEIIDGKVENQTFVSPLIWRKA